MTEDIIALFFILMGHYLPTPVPPRVNAARPTPPYRLSVSIADFMQIKVTKASFYYKIKDIK